MKPMHSKNSKLVWIASFTALAIVAACSEPAPAKKIGANLNALNTGTGTGTGTGSGTSSSSSSSSNSSSSATGSNTPPPVTNQNGNTGDSNQTDQSTNGTGQPGAGGQQQQGAMQGPVAPTGIVTLLGSVKDFKLTFDAALLADPAGKTQIGALLLSNDKATFYVRQVGDQAKIAAKKYVDQGAGSGPTCAIRINGDTSKIKAEDLAQIQSLSLVMTKGPSKVAGHFYATSNAAKNDAKMPAIVMGCWNAKVNATTKNKEAINMDTVTVASLNAAMKGVFQIEDQTAGN